MLDLCLKSLRWHHLRKQMMVENGMHCEWLFSLARLHEINRGRMRSILRGTLVKQIQTVSIDYIAIISCRKSNFKNLSKSIWIKRSILRCIMIDKQAMMFLLFSWCRIIVMLFLGCRLKSRHAVFCWFAFQIFFIFVSIST